VSFAWFTRRGLRPLWGVLLTDGRHLGPVDRDLLRGGARKAGLSAARPAKAGWEAAGLAKAGRRWTEKSKAGSGKGAEAPGYIDLSSRCSHELATEGVRAKRIGIMYVYRGPSWVT